MRCDRTSLQVEILEARIVPDSAPIGPLQTPDNPTPYNYPFYHKINSSLAAVDVPSLLRIASPADAERLRADLIQYIWKDAGFPANTLPTASALDVPAPLEAYYPELPNLQRIDRLTVTMDYGLQSAVYLFHPEQSSNRLAIWQQGHDNDLAATGGYYAIAAFLERGYTVAAAWLPLFGDNAFQKPFQIGACPITPYLGDHTEFACAESDQFTPLLYFVEPVAVALNYALSKAAYEDVVMIGLSGGGWTTTLYAALDPRVRVSVPVAGTLPLFLRTAPYANDLGDWEQSESGIFALGDYLDWYTLGAFGPGRKQVQILNKFDDCCFAGVRFRTYLDHVKDTVRDLGSGAFTAYLDDSMRLSEKVPSHQVSLHALMTVVFHEVEGDAVQFVDDGENTYWNGGGTTRDTFHERGAWLEALAGGFAGDVRMAKPGPGDARAVWQFQVTPGRYRIALTWNPSLIGASTSAPFTVYDDETWLYEAAVNQREVPLDFIDGLVGWQLLGEFEITSTRLVVELSNTLDGPVLADGVRIERVANRPAPGRAFPIPIPFTFFAPGTFPWMGEVFLPAAREQLQGPPRVDEPAARNKGEQAPALANVRGRVRVLSPPFATLPLWFECIA